MSRLFFLIAIAVVIYLLIRAFRASATAKGESRAAEDMVRCAHCGVHIPRSDSVQSEGRFFCGNEHRDAFRN